jgi:RNA polymerase sigma-70 factor (ECF subfamily)
MQESDLLRNILSRDRRALYTFYKTYTPQLAQYIKGKVKNPADAEEVLQDTLYAFLEAARDFEGKSNVKTFLFSICSHKIVDFYRRRKVKHFVFSQVPQLENLVSPLIGPEDQLDARILADKIRFALGKIMPGYRAILVSKYADELSIKDIARKFTITLKSAESRLFRARKAFVKAFIAT